MNIYYGYSAKDNKWFAYYLNKKNHFIAEGKDCEEADRNLRMQLDENGIKNDEKSYE